MEMGGRKKPSGDLLDEEATAKELRRGEGGGGCGFARISEIEARRPFSGSKAVGKGNGVLKSLACNSSASIPSAEMVK
jgi:hypothetical protein